MNTVDHAGGDWECLTPWTDADGRALSLGERLMHAARIIARLNEAELDKLMAALERDPDVPADVRLRIIRAAADVLIKASGEYLRNLGAELLIEHSAGPFIQRSNEVH